MNVRHPALPMLSLSLVLAVLPATVTRSARAAANSASQPQAVTAAPNASEGDAEASLTTWIAKVNGDPIPLRFFTRRLYANRSAAYRRFAGEGGGAVGADFWNTDFAGETPARWLKQRVLDECVRIQLEFALAKRTGLIPDPSYSAFLGALDQENEWRRTALARGEPIYGPRQYGEDEYLTYVLNNLRLGVQKRLAGTEFQASDEALWQLYQSVKDTFFDRGFRVKVWAIDIPFGHGGDGEPNLTVDEARAKAAEAKQRLDKGELFEELAAQYNEGGTLNEQVFDFESRSADKTHWAEIRDEAMSLQEGEVSGVFQAMNSFHILKCIERDPLGYRPFEAVRDQVRRLYLEQRYAELVNELVRTAQIEVNPAEIERVAIR